jgi:hypothetical protein
MRGNFSAVRALKVSVAVIAGGVIGLAGIVRCTRDNPVDPKSNNFVPGTAPEAAFLQDPVTGFIRDSISMTVVYSDTQAYGGRTPRVTRLYFNWTGDSSIAAMTDSVTVSGVSPATVKRYFTAPRNTMAYVRARDNDGQLSPAAGAQFVVDEGKPTIKSTPVTVPADSIVTGDPLVVTASASDTNGTIAAYIWTVLGKDTATLDSVLHYVFPGTAGGMQTIYVRVTDDDGAVSLRDSVTIRVVPRNDVTGPSVLFFSPLDSAVVGSSVISVQVRVSDPSGVAFVNVNSNAATLISGTDLDGVYQRVSIGLDEGPNSVIIQAMDKSSNFNQTWDTLHVTYRKPDNTPPAIQFSYPDSGDIVYQSPITVAVTVTDQSGVAWVLCGVDTMSNPSGSSYTANVVLIEGLNSLIITARDTRGNTAIDTLIFTYAIRDKTPPAVTITAPLPGQHITANNVSVSVLATDSSGIASVTVNGLPASLNGGVYMRNVPLVHGPDTIRVVATDASPVSNQTRDSVIVIQNAPPHFVPDTSVRDTSGLWVDSVALIAVDATDSDNDSLNFSFVTMPTKATAPTITRTGSSATITLTPTSAGADSFKVRVADSVYNAADTIMVRVMNVLPDYLPPAIAFVTPLPDDTVRDTLHPSPVTVMVSVSDPSGVAWVKCNGVSMNNPSGNSYRTDLSLNEGRDSLIISAMDTRGNIGADTLFMTYLVFRDTVAPYVHITAPQPNEHITAASVTVMEIGRAHV